VYSAGISYLLELYDCPPEILDDQVHIEAAIREAVDHANATLLELVTRRFAPQGVTALALLAESHISIHTWPELGYALPIFSRAATRQCPNGPPNTLRMRSARGGTRSDR
jgi:S-adenosylmethionine decarboxylase proenzyme